MNIAHLLPYGAHFPLQKHNGRYEWALKLAREQAKKGHLVTIYAAPGSFDKTSTILWQSTANDKKDKLLNNTALIQQALLSKEHDIFHSHFDSLHYNLAHLTSKPIVVTQHWFPNEEIAAIAQKHHVTNVHVVPVTHLMETADKKLSIPTVTMIYHGIDLSLFLPSKETKPRRRLIFFGRITPAKGVKEAVLLAIKTRSELDIVGKVNDVDLDYWNQILPLIDGKRIRYLGPLSQERVAALLRDAKAFIFPSKHQEAFGLVTIEAQACGTPVIISDIGPSAELVRHGRTGYVCSSDNDYIKAIEQIDTISRSECRVFAERFSDKQMYERYEKLYDSLMSV